MRKNKFSLVIAGFLILSTFCFAEPEENSWRQETYKVSIKISNIKSTEGSIIMSIHDSDKSFSKKIPLTTIKLSPQVPDVFYTENLKSGEYAFCVYHDVNNNGQLDSNFVGIPKEPFGFSNYNGKSVPGNFKKHKIFISQDCEVIIPVSLISE